MHNRRLPVSFLIITLALFLSGCASHTATPSQNIQRPDGNPQEDHAAVEPAAAVIVRSVIGYSVEGRPIDMITLGPSSTPSPGNRTVLILPTIHGNEDAGTPLVERLADHLAANPDLFINTTVILIPCANPDGMARQTRHNAHSIDLNRNFPADNFRTSRRFGLAPLSEPESIAVYDVIRNAAPDIIVTIHQPLACIDYDGPGLDLADAMANACGLPVNKLGAQPGSLGAYVGETLGIPIITLELPGNTDHLTADALWSRYGPALLIALE